MRLGYGEGNCSVEGALNGAPAVSAVSHVGNRRQEESSLLNSRKGISVLIDTSIGIMGCCVLFNADKRTLLMGDAPRDGDEARKRKVC